MIEIELHSSHQHLKNYSYFPSDITKKEILVSDAQFMYIMLFSSQLEVYRAEKL